MYWTIQLGTAAEETFSDAGLRLVSVTRRNLAPSIAKLTASPEDGITATPIALRTRIIIRRRATSGATPVIWFTGWISKATPVISGTAHRIEYEAQNALYWFERIAYQQTWYTLVDPTNLAASLVGGYRTRVLLGRGVNNTRLTIRDIMADVIDQVVDAAATSGLPDVPIQAALSEYPDLEIPTRELQSVTHGGIIRECLKYLPDSVVWVDDTTTPPTLRLTRRATATTRSLDVGDHTIGSIGLVRQTEMEFSRVAVIYARTDEVNGAQVGYTTADVYPVPGGFDANDPTTYNSFLLDFDCLVHYVDLQGWGISTVYSTLVTRTWDLTSETWWRNHHAQLEAGITGPDGTGSPVFTPIRVTYEDGSTYEYTGPVGVAPVLNYELVNTGGAIHEGFFLTGTSTPVVKYRYRVEATVAYRDANGVAFHAKPVFAEFTATNAPSGTYSKTDVYQVGEDPVTGLAQEMHTALSAARWQGSIPITDTDPDTTVGLGDLVNLINGRTEWETMDAQVQSIEEVPDQGTRTLNVGPVGFLSATDRIELMRGLRDFGPGAGRTPPSLQSSGGASATIVTTPNRVPTQNTVAGDSGKYIDKLGRDDGAVDITVSGEGRLHMVCTDTTPDVTDGAEIDLDLADCADKVLTVRELDYCEAGVQRKILVLASAPYD